MYGSRKGLAVLIGVFLITGFFSVSSASSVIQHGRSGNDPFFGLMHKLNLTAAQKAEVAAILKSNEPTARTIATGLANAGAQVRKDILNGSFNADHFNALVTYEQQGAQLRAKNIAAILPILTKDQQAILQNIQDKVDSKMNAAIDARFASLDKWIAKHSK